jgi:hypothetical protein
MNTCIRPFTRFPALRDFIARLFFSVIVQKCKERKRTLGVLGQDLDLPGVWITMYLEMESTVSDTNDHEFYTQMTDTKPTEATIVGQKSCPYFCPKGLQSHSGGEES